MEKGKKKFLWITSSGVAISNCINNLISAWDESCKIITVDFKTVECELKLQELQKAHTDWIIPVNKKTGRINEKVMEVIQKQLIKIQKIEKFQYVITCSGNFLVHDFGNIIKQTSNCGHAIYLVDPYTFNGNYPSQDFAIRMSDENACFDKADVIFCTPIMYQDYTSNEGFEERLIKIHPVDLPMIVCPSNEIERIKKEESNRSLLVYAGGLYPKIRNPRYLFSVMKHLESCELIMAGRIPRRYRLLICLDFKLRGKIKILGQIDKEKLYEYYMRADALVNIGNSVKNQLPSKLLEYISTGRPIVNICKIDECLSKKYLDRYPLHVNLFEKNSWMTSRKELTDFLSQIKNEKGYSFGFIEQQYRKNTPEYVAAEMKKVLDKNWVLT